MENIIELNSDDFNNKISKGKVLVEFYSKSCGPCKMLSFVLRDVAKECKDLKILAVDFDDHKEVIKKYQVEGYPTMILFIDGIETNRMNGLQQKPKIVNMINS